MGNPILRRIRNNTFGNGPVVRANDGALLAELQGNAAKKINISAYETYHDITAKVSFFAADALDVSESAQSSTPAESGIVWLHRVPRKKRLVRSSMYNLLNQIIVPPGLDANVRLMKSDKFPGDPSYDIEEMGEEIDKFTVDTTSASGDTTLAVGYGGTAIENTLCRAGDYLFLYSTFSIPEDKTKVDDFNGLSQFGVLSLHLVFKEEHA
jgi:hypothetical protein